ncbi:MAG TPA: 50S ribosomal protein L18 [Rhizomicrobium sp.]|jgi:large subunit ribosomal protein L18|nr:50S ribosomal protein L18 [Rhizomicrobium sp.]
MSNPLFKKRRARTRYRIVRTAERPRLSVFRSGKHIYAQVIDDRKALTLAAASSAEKDSGIAKGYNVEAATNVGKKIAERTLAAGIREVVFDRGGYIYHGRVKALADAAREGGLEF